MTNSVDIEKLNKPFTYKDFSHLDDSNDLDYLLKASNTTGNLKTIQGIKQRAIELLKIKPGATVLELGCGVGQDSAYLGNLVGNEGQVIAVDNSNVMLDYARKHNAHRRVSYQHTNAQALDYPNNYFDAIYVDRLLVSQIDVDSVLKEAVRVLKPHGRVVVTDLDFGTVFIYPYQEHITEILIKRLQDIVENKFIGRKLPEYFVKHQLQIEAILPEAYVLTDFHQTNTMIDFPRIINDLVGFGKITKKEATSMLSSLEEANENKVFLYGLTLFTVTGIKN